MSLFVKAEAIALNLPELERICQRYRVRSEDVLSNLRPPIQQTSASRKSTADNSSHDYEMVSIAELKQRFALQNSGLADVLDYFVNQAKALGVTEFALPLPKRLGVQATAPEWVRRAIRVSPIAQASPAADIVPDNRDGATMRQEYLDMVHSEKAFMRGHVAGVLELAGRASIRYEIAPLRAALQGAATANRALRYVVGFVTVGIALRSLKTVGGGCAPHLHIFRAHVILLDVFSRAGVDEVDPFGEPVNLINAIALDSEFGGSLSCRNVWHIVDRLLPTRNHDFECPSDVEIDALCAAGYQLMFDVQRRERLREEMGL